MDLSWDKWLSDFSNYGWWEIPAVLGAILYVLLAARKNKWCFLFGFISSAIYVYLTIELKLYFDTFINAYYVLIAVYGYILWNNTSKEEEVSVRQIGWRKLLAYSIFILLLSQLLGWWAEEYTDNSLPYWDAFTTVFAVVASYWVVKRIIENWIIWIVVDIVCIAIYLYKGLPLTALLFLIYTIMAIYGYINWNRKVAI